LRRSDSIRNNRRNGPARRPRIAEWSDLLVQGRLTSRPRPGRRERTFWMQRQGAKNHHEKGRTPAETKSGKQVAGNPRRSALFGVDWGKGGLRRLDGGGSWAQTGDPPPSHRTGLRPAPGTEISYAETGRQKPAHHLAETESETRRERESPHFRAISARRLAKV
jgi:hypothetical protein